MACITASGWSVVMVLCLAFARTRCSPWVTEPASAA